MRMLRYGIVFVYYVPALSRREDGYALSIARSIGVKWTPSSPSFDWHVTILSLGLGSTLFL